MFCGRCTNGYRGEEGKDRPPCRACHRHNRLIREYAEELASHMGLADWTIAIRHDPTDADTYAEIECVYGQRLARIGLNRNWLTYTREMQRDTLVQIGCDLQMAAPHINGVLAVAAIPA